MSEHTGPEVRVRVYVLGTLHLERRMPDGRWEEVPTTSEEGGIGHPTRSFLRYLLAHGRCVGRGTILDTLWTDVDSADRYLYNAASTLRRILRSDEQAPLLETIYNRTTYKLADQSRVWVDVDHCTALLQDVKRIGSTSEHGLHLLQEAELLFRRGPLFADEPGDWCFGLREQTKTMQYRCQLWLAEAYEAHQQLAEAEIVVEALLTQDPTDERALRQLMTLLHKQGLTSEAVRRYKQTALFLRQKEMVLSAETEAHVQAIQRGSGVTQNDQRSKSSGDERRPLFSHALPQDQRHSFTNEGGDTNSITSSGTIMNRRSLLEGVLDIASFAVGTQAWLQHEELDRLLETLKKLSRLDKRTLTSVQSITENYWHLRISGHVPLSDLLDAALTHLQMVKQLFRASYTPTSRTFLCSIFSETALFLGKLLSTDMHMPNEALSFYKLSLTFSQQANDDRLYAAVLGRIGAFTASASNAEAAMVYLQEAQHAVASAPAFTLRAWLAAEEAEVQATRASQGHSESMDACFRMLEQAEYFANQVQPEEDTFGVYFDGARIQGYHGSCNLRLHRPDVAFLALQHALEQVQPVGALARAVLLDLATASIQAKHIEQACTYLAQALAIVVQTHSSLQDVYHLREQLVAWKTSPDVQQFDALLQSVASIA